MLSRRGFLATLAAAVGVSSVAPTKTPPRPKLTDEQKQVIIRHLHEKMRGMPVYDSGTIMPPISYDCLFQPVRILPAISVQKG